MSMYKFNTITGRLVRAGQSLGQGIKATTEPAATTIIYESSAIKFAPVATEFKKKGQSSKYGDLDPKFSAKCKYYQKDDGVPIHLKGGTQDVVLYYITLALCALGLEETVRYIYESAFPKKPE